MPDKFPLATGHILIVSKPRLSCCAAAVPSTHFTAEAGQSYASGLCLNFGQASGS